VKDGNGRVPDEFDDLRKLPGIGDYTASAVLSIAFNKPYPVIDANVKRVTARLFNRGTGTTGFDTFIGHKLRELLPGDRPGDFNEAVMELGQTVCLNRDPLCGRCPLSAGCGALKAGAQDKVLGRKTRKITHLKTRVLVLVKEGRVMLQRSETNLMRSLWKFPGIPLSEPVRTSLKRLGLMLVRQGEALHPLVHHYTVHREELLPVMIDVRGKGEKSDSVRWARLNNLGKYPMPSVYRKIASAVSGMRA
jgi:A/G-specific adenine glycosylase